MNQPESTNEQEGARLAELLGDRNRTAFAKEFDVPGGGSMISQHVSGHRPISLKAAAAYARGLGVPVSAFSPRLAAEIQAAAPMTPLALRYPLRDHNVAEAPASFRPRRYPVISHIQAGGWAEIIDNFQPGDAEEWIDSPVDLGKEGFILKIKGQSMTNPEGGRDNFPEGMYVHINPQVEAQVGNFVAAKRVADNEATFKKLVNVDGELHLFAINPVWPRPYIKLQKGDKIIGVLKFAGWSF